MPEPTLEIRQVDAGDEIALRAWWEVGRAAEADRPYDAWPAWEVSRRALPLQPTGREVVLLAAHEGDAVVGTGLVVFTLLENQHLVEGQVYVVPERRRRSIGSKILAEIEELARSRGRTTIIAGVFALPGSESPGTLFSGTHGFSVASEEETKLVSLADARPAWGALEEEVEEARGAYGYQAFEDRCPDEHIESLCRVLSVFMSEIPTGELDLHDVTWTPQRLREGEERSVAMGRTTIVGLALDPDGQVCGFSDLRVHPEAVDQASVGGTLVLPAHRGHRLGLGMKLATHRRLLELFPTCERVETGNAGVNAPMNSVNERLGYRVVERALDVQKVLS